VSEYARAGVKVEAEDDEEDDEDFLNIVDVKNGAIAQFKKVVFGHNTAKIHLISYLCVIIVSIMASMVVDRFNCS
jgi:hypothetical protein